MAVPRVVLIGGAPLVGKSTVARLLAGRLGYGCVSTDDLGQAIRSVTTRESHPAFHLMDGIDYREYYVSRSVAQLVGDAESYHAALWPAIASFIGAHASWAGPVVLEGWALQRQRVAALDSDGIVSVWLTADEEIFLSRMRCDIAFWRGASDEEAMIAHFVGRSLHYDARIRQLAAQSGSTRVEVTASASSADLCAQCMAVIGREA